MEGRKINVQVIIAIVLSITLLAGAVFIVNYKPNKKKSKVNYATDSEIVTTDPVKTATLYIKANGTMGDVKDVNVETLKTFEAMYQNKSRRINALDKVREATIPGSPLITGQEEDNIKVFINSFDDPRLYNIENIEASDYYNERKLAVYSEAGPIEYNAVDVDVAFDSIVTYFTAPSDTSYDGTFTQMENRETFDTTVTLVQSGDLWFMYDILNSEYDLNERFATWSGVGSPYINYEESEYVGEIKIPGVLVEEEPGGGEEGD